LPKIIIENEEP
jgi:hypothetical protein